MTTKPKAMRFRVKPRADTQSPSELASSKQPDDLADTDAAGSPKTAPETQTEELESKPELIGIDAEIESIRQEQLTNRQLRMARRLAQKHGLPAVSDLDAVRLLRNNGIDPLQHTNVLDSVEKQNSSDNANAKLGKIQLPQVKSAQGNTLPSTELNPEDQRMKEINAIQWEIVRRRRRKLALLITRLSFFIFLPTLIAWWYFSSVATPMYSTKSEFLILTNDGGGGGVAGLFGGTAFATSQDSIAVQSYLQSKDAMLRLDKDLGFREHFSEASIDAIQRISPDATNEQVYKVYRKNVVLGYDPTEGVIRMEVVAADPVLSAEYSDHLIGYAEERVNQLSEQKRADQMKDAEQAYEEALGERRVAQEALVNLQRDASLLDPEAVVQTYRSQIAQAEGELIQKNLQLSTLKNNPRPNQARVAGVEAEIERLETLLDQLNKKMVDASNGQQSLAEHTVRMQMAEADLVSRDLLLQEAMQQRELTRREASRQVRYLTTSVVPVVPQQASYPRVFENTMLTLLVFGGVYLMLSLTASILREQVTT